MWHIKGSIQPHLICDVNCNIQMRYEVLLYQLNLQKKEFLFECDKGLFFLFLIEYEVLIEYKALGLQK